MELVTQAEYARRIGVSKVAIHKQVKAGVIILRDGKVNPAEADAARARHCDPEKLRGKVSTPAKATPRPQSTSKKRKQPSRKTVQIPRSETIPAEPFSTADLENDEPPTEISRADELARGEWLKNKKRFQDLDVSSGRLIDREKARREVFALGRQFREHWTNWPARIAPILASELGVDPKHLQGELDRLVRDHLSELADPKLKADRCKAS